MISVSLALAFNYGIVKKLYILRHGETEYNRLKMVQGSGIDAPLNATGQQQATAFYTCYKNIPFDKIYLSNLMRTGQTVQGFIDQGIPVEKLVGLREISWGVQEGVAFTPETSSQYQLTCQKWSAGDLTCRIEGGESPLEVAERQREALNAILAAKEERLVLVCTHGRAMRIMLCWMLNYPLSYMEHFGHSNTGLYVVNFTGKQFSIEIFNETSHLNGHQAE